MRIAWVVFGAIVLCGCAREHGPSAGELIRTAETPFEKGDFLSAAALYEQAGEVAPDAVEPFYNLAVAYYRSKLYDMTLRYLDRIQPTATGLMRVRCLLLRGDVEYRSAMAEKSLLRVEALERALYLYREALGLSSSDEALQEIAKYDVEVVKLKLPGARSEAPQVRGQGEVDETPAEEMSFETGAPEQKRGRRSGAEEKDW